MGAALVALLPQECWCRPGVCFCPADVEKGGSLVVGDFDIAAKYGEWRLHCLGKKGQGKRLGPCPTVWQMQLGACEAVLGASGFGF